MPIEEGMYRLPVGSINIENLQGKHYTKRLIDHLKGRWYKLVATEQASFDSYVKEHTPDTAEGALADTMNRLSPEQKIKRLVERINKVEELRSIQCKDGNWDYDEYMRGLANGLILAISVLTETDPQWKEKIEKEPTNGLPVNRK